jgi:hypothetical protein
MKRIATLAVALLGAGCSLFSPKVARNEQLANVAKDWCMTIRASQVLCVYPLSEDVQVGDIYLVNTSIPDQIAQYEAKGFLPFDMLLTRLQPVNYRAMYANAYATQDQWGNIPHQWQFPPNAAANANNWIAAPHAAFPSYTFSVQQGQGLKLAVPVQAVPVGLSLLNSNQASGSIEIDNASTYGIDQRSLDEQVEAWAACPATRTLLARYAPQGPDKHYLRVITRVYLTGKLNVSLQRQSSRGGGIDAGASQPAISLSGTDYATLLSNLTTAVNGGTVAKPGGSIRVAAISGNSVSLSETFDRPIVIGYLAYDRAIGDNGFLGQPRSTMQQLEQTGAPTPPPLPNADDVSKRFGDDANSVTIRNWVADPQNRATLRQYLQDENVTLPVAMVLNAADQAPLRQRIVDQFNLGGPCGTTAH